MPRSTFVKLSTVCLLVLAGTASGDVVVTNLGEPLRATTAVGNNPNPVPPPDDAPEWVWAAQSFSTDSGVYTLTTITVVGGVASGAPEIVADLYSDNAGQIGSFITSMVTPDFGGPIGPRVLTPAGPVQLDANTTYWVVLGSSAPGDGTFGVSYANNNNSVGTGVIGPYADSGDSGATWRYGVENPYFIQVVAEPVQKCTPCPGDANGDLTVDFTDIVSVLGQWGSACR